MTRKIERELRREFPGAVVEASKNGHYKVHLPNGETLHTGRGVALVISNCGPCDVTYQFGVWNVTRAVRDCRAGRHKRWQGLVEELYPCNRDVAFDEAKVAALNATMRWCEPLIGVVENGKIYLIDGRHRLEVLHRRGIKWLLHYVIEEPDSEPYRVLFNGARKPPWETTS